MNEIINIHAGLWAGYHSHEVSQALDWSDKENRFEEQWQCDHYFSVGRDALRIVMLELLHNGRGAPASILDFPSGSGRVTRHLRAMFPEARIGACDLYASHIAFCEREFGAEPIQSEENLAALDVGQWDLIFCGSLLTHLPHPLFMEAIRFMARSLTPDGIAIATVEGRHSIHIQDHKWKLIGDDLFEIARAQYHETGFGFVDYDAGFRDAAFASQGTYGVALINPSRLLGEIQSLEDVQILGFRERAWDDHQDVVVFGRPGVNV